MSDVIVIVVAGAAIVWTIRFVLSELGPRQQRPCWPRWRHQWARETDIGETYRIRRECQLCGTVDTWWGRPGDVIPRRFL